MKVEVITLHHVTNFGSLLQTYATQRAIEKLGQEAEILDFVPDGLSFKRGCWPQNNTPFWKKLLKLCPLIIVNAIEYLDVRRFLNKYIHLTPVRYYSYREILDYVPEADIYMSGSDQIWNTQNNNPIEDYKAYFLGFAPEGKRRIAYAGSFGKSSFTKEEDIIIRQYLDKYDYLSVREDEGLDILHSFGIDRGVHVLDPTMLLTGEEWKAFASFKKKPRLGYVFVYNLNRNTLVKDIAKVIAREKGLRIINFADNLDFFLGAKNLFFNSAEDLINYIANADYVITDSFHGTAFALNLNRQVVVARAPRFNSRIESILRLAGLLDTRLVDSVEEGINAITRKIDYSVVNSCIVEARNRSLKYLKAALSNG